MILIDFNNLASACFLVNYKQAPELDFFRHILITKILAVKKKFENTHGNLTICADSGSWRREIFPPYKYKRRMLKESEKLKFETMKKFTNTIYDEFVEYLPYTCIKVPGAEGDDIIGTFVHKALGKANPYAPKHLIVSEDKDFLQLTGYPNVTQYRSVRKDFPSSKDPDHALAEMILRGDADDGIPNFMSDDEIFMQEGHRQKPVTKKVIADFFAGKPEDSEFYEGWLRNKKLIDLKEIDENVEAAIFAAYINKPKKTPKIMDYLMEKRLNTLLDRLPDFSPLERK